MGDRPTVRPEFPLLELGGDGLWDRFAVTSRLTREPFLFVMNGSPHGLRLHSESHCFLEDLCQCILGVGVEGPVDGHVGVHTFAGLQGG